MSEIIELVGEFHAIEEVIHEIGTIVTLGGSGGAGGGVWLSGEGAPAPALGAKGDFYLDTSTGDVHRKLADVWYFQLKIKGRDGEDGEDGNDGVSPHLHIRFAQDEKGTGFSDTPDPSRPYIAHLVTTSPASPAAGAFAGKWIRFIGTDGEDGEDGDPGSGLPAGGTTGQYARKASNSPFDVEWADFPAVEAPSQQVIRMGHQEANSVPGGPAISGSWFTRKMNHLYRAALPGAIFDAVNYRVWLEPLPSGLLYGYRWTMRAYAVDSWMGRLYSPEAEVDLRSMAAFSSSANAAQKDAEDFGEFTIANPGWFYMQMRCDSSRLVNDGCGYAMWYDGPEIYLKLDIWIQQ